MKESELFVDNPLALRDLYPGGVFMVRENPDTAESLAEMTQVDILNLLHYPELERLPVKATDLLAKIMTAVKFKGKLLQTEDYTVLNSGQLPDGKNIPGILKDLSPAKVLLWTDKWVLESKEIPFYQKGVVENVEILRCHSLHTVMADAERKKACWSAIRAYFGM